MINKKILGAIFSAGCILGISTQLHAATATSSITYQVTNASPDASISWQYTEDPSSKHKSDHVPQSGQLSSQKVTEIKDSFGGSLIDERHYRNIMGFSRANSSEVYCNFKLVFVSGGTGSKITPDIVPTDGGECTVSLGNFPPHFTVTIPSSSTTAK